MPFVSNYFYCLVRNLPQNFLSLSRVLQHFLFSLFVFALKLRDLLQLDADYNSRRSLFIMIVLTWCEVKVIGVIPLMQGALLIALWRDRRGAGKQQKALSTKINEVGYG